MIIDLLIKTWKEYYGIIILVLILLIFSFKHLKPSLSKFKEYFSKFKFNEDDRYEKYPRERFFNEPPKQKTGFFSDDKIFDSQSITKSKPNLMTDTDKTLESVKADIKSLENHKKGLINYEKELIEDFNKRMEEVDKIKEQSNINYEFLVNQYNILLEIKNKYKQLKTNKIK